jgi:3',5'-nucleoside bisphosphate phosphatase
LGSDQAGVDLHIHTKASDGALSPIEVIALARRYHLNAIAIADHDTLDGVRAVVDAGIPTGIPNDIEFITGVEISADPPLDYELNGSFHILGYGFQLDHPQLNTVLAEQQAARQNRNPLICEKLQQLGVQLTYDELKKRFPDVQLARPHIARLMIEKGYVKTINEAFDRYLHKNQSAYVEKKRIGCAHAIQLIHDAGGVSVLAHPFYVDLPSHQTLREFVIHLKKIGLAGIEAYYPDHSVDCVKTYLALADELDLIITGGTDFHGAIKPDIQIGIGKGDFKVPYHIYEDLLQEIKRRSELHSK